MLDLHRDAEQAAACRLLWSAVMFEAMATFKTWRREGKHVLEGRKAEAWLLRDEGQGVGSFAWVCHVLSLDPVAVREQLRRQFQPCAANRAERLAEVA